MSGSERICPMVMTPPQIKMRFPAHETLGQGVGALCPKAFPYFQNPAYPALQGLPDSLCRHGRIGSHKDFSLRSYGNTQTTAR